MGEELNNASACRLCEQHEPLVRSHLIPAAVYRLLRNSSSAQNPLVGRPGKEPVSSSFQYQAKLLCRNCEERFNRCGEHWVFRHGLHADGSFPLRTLLRKGRPAASWPHNQTRIYQAANFRQINVSAIAYFAASIFWRASIHSWERKKEPPVKLGRYEQEFKSYLLGQLSFPEHAALWAIVREEGIADFVTHVPTSKRGAGFHAHNFTMPGFGFMLFVGRYLQPIHQQLCFVRGQGNPISMSPHHEQHVEMMTRYFIPGSIID